MALVEMTAPGTEGVDRQRALEIIALNGMFDEKDATGVLHQAVELLGSDFAVVSSFGADSAILLHHVSVVDPDLPVLFLETGKHFPETLDYVETLRSQLGLTNVRFLTPDEADLTRFDPKGDLWETDPDSCCHIRKTEPLNFAVAGFAGWATGRRRGQTSARGVLPHFELTSDDRIKVNPLAYFANEDIEAYKAEHGLPEHPLFGRGYKSIGCEPCTSIVADGEDPRSGRWRGFDKTECGIHFDVNGKIAMPHGKAEFTLYKGGKFIADPWRAWADDDDPATVRYTHVPFGIYLERITEFEANPHPIGLLISPGEEIEDVAGDLKRFASIAIAFPAFTDGRGYSTARLLVERYEFASEIRAVGDVLADQIPFMRRCGVNAFVVTHAATCKALEEGRLATVGLFLQPVGASAEVPVGTRPFLRQPAPEDTPEGV
jgi:phosphoadenosine phosphosulfate reductase